MSTRAPSETDLAGRAAVATVAPLLEQVNPRALSALVNKSLNHLEHLLTSSINFEGRPFNALIDELQCVLNPACVLLDLGPSFIANVLPDEREVLLQTLRGVAREELGSGSSLSVNRALLGPLRDRYSGPVPLRLALGGATWAYEFRLPDSTADSLALTICLESESILLREENQDELFRYIREALTLVSGAQAAFDPSNGIGIERLYTQFLESQYLEAVLGALRDRIRTHLYKSGDPIVTIDNPFWLQFYLASGPPTPAVQRHSLRFLPLKEQRQVLATPDTLVQIQTALREASLVPPERPASFITQYDFNSDRAFAGYCCDTGCSLYLRNWTEEPRARGTHLSPEQQRERSIATTILQTLRCDSRDLFILPLFAHREPIGVVVINCQEPVSAEHRLLPVRTVQELGFLLSLSLKTDDLVNHIQEEKRRTAQARSYKHATQSILHGEGTYCMAIQEFLDAVRANRDLSVHKDLAPLEDRVAYIVREKRSLVLEFSDNDDPIRKVPELFVHPTLRKVPKEYAGVSLAELRHLFDILQGLFCGSGRLSTELAVGERLTTLGAIPDFDYFVLARILANLIKNSLNAATKREVGGQKIRVAVDVVRCDGGDALHIVATDNCGGFQDPDIPHEVTFDSWSAYLYATESRRGMGFFTFARYAAATAGGYCRVGTAQGLEVGAKVEILLPSLH